MRTAAVGLIAAVYLAGFLPSRAEAPAAYRVEFEIRDAAAPAGESAQHFTMVVDESRKGVFRAEKRVPAPAPPNLEVGVKIECAVRASTGGVELTGSLEQSEIVATVSSGDLQEPIIGQSKLAFHTTLVPGRSTLISDNPKRQIFATVQLQPI